MTQPERSAASASRPQGGAKVRLTRRATLLLAGFLTVIAAPVGAATPRAVSGFATPTLEGVVRLSPVSASGEEVLYRFSGGADWPALRFRAAGPLDWSDAGELAVPVDNAGERAFTLLIRLDDDPAADGGDRSLTGIITLPPGAHGSVVLPLDAAPAGMRGRPVRAASREPGDRPVTDLRGSVSTRHIVAMHLSGVRTSADAVLAIGTPVLRGRSAGAGRSGAIADRYGQSVAGAWPEKVVDDADLGAKLARADVQTRRLARDAAPGLVGRGRFGVEKAGGRWRFVDPGGRPFFSLGVDAVAASNPTLVSGRAHLFAELPAPGSPLATFRRGSGTGETFDVGEANLARALGPDWRRRWTAGTLARLRAWGFNTLGNWSDPDPAAGGLASVTFYDFEGATASVPMEGGRTLPDPFDPRYPALADEIAARMTQAHRDTPALLGYFSGNEMPWGRAEEPGQGIVAHVLSLSADSPAKRALVGVLRGRYDRYEAFAHAWALPAGGGWETLLQQSVHVPTPVGPAARADIAAFQGQFAQRYFSTVAEAIRRHDPSGLYLGTRFADAPPEVVAACARWCDVMSFNVYGASPATAADRWRGFQRPVLIGEFHFGSTDRGSFWPGMVDAGAEERRGPAYAAYLEGALADPSVVGVHWYQYADEPLTGRPYDGENGHIGLVAITDVPYAGFVEAVAAANRRTLHAFDTAVKRTSHTVP